MEKELENQPIKELTPREISNANLRKFGDEKANPRSSELGIKPWSIRNSLRYMAHAEIETDDEAEDLSEREIMRKILPKKRTVAQMIAARSLAKAIKGDQSATSYATDQIDGKLAQTNINADFAALMGMSDDDLARIADGADTATETSCRADDPAATGGNAPAASGENAGD